MKRRIKTIGHALTLIFAIIAFNQIMAYTENPKMVSDISLGASNSSPQNYVEINDELYFAANGGSLVGNELYRYDPATDTLSEVDINPGATGSNPQYLTVMNGKLYFSADAGDGKGVELYSYDPATSLFSLVADVNGGAVSSSPQNLTNVNGTLFFSAEYGINGRELWVSDGTAAGTQLVIDLYNGTDSSDPQELTAYKGKCYFSATVGADDFLHESDGTAGGTKRVKYGAAPSDVQTPSNLTVSGAAGSELLFFSAFDGSFGIELWCTDGSADTMNTFRIINIMSGAGNSDPQNLTDVDGTLFFTANNGFSTGETGRELYKSDGTAGGTLLVEDIYLGDGASANPAYLTNINGVLYFSAVDGISSQLWKCGPPSYDSATTEKVTSFAGGHTGIFKGFTAFDGKVFFTTSDVSSPENYELWSSDGTAAGTQMVADINGNPSLSSINDTSFGENTIVVSDWLFFPADNGTNGIELWKYRKNTLPTSSASSVNALEDQTYTFLKTDFNYSDTDGDPLSDIKIVSLVASGALQVSGTDVILNQVVSSTDIESGKLTFNTTVLDDFGSGYASFEYRVIDSYGAESSGSFIMTINVDPVNDHPKIDPIGHYWVQEGTPSLEINLTGINNGDGGENGITLTASSDKPAIIPNPMISYSDPSSTGTLFINPTPGQYGYVTITVSLADDGGTANGGDNDNDVTFTVSVLENSNPFQIADMSAGVGSTTFGGEFLAIGNKVFFTADDGLTGQELWVHETDTQKTRLVKDICIGPPGSDPNNLVEFDGQLYFAADEAGSIELWKSDGTAAGTQKIVVSYDLTPAAEVSRLTVVDGTLFFKAYHSDYDYHIWKSDGTAAGSEMLTDQSDSYDYYVDAVEFSGKPLLVGVDGTLFFVASDGTNGKELWKYDDATGKVKMVKDIYPGVNDGDPSNLTAVGGILYFSADDGSTGYELWRSDGTDPGTYLVKDIEPGSGWSEPCTLTNVNGTLFFCADDGVNGVELWKSDGSDPGTTLVADIYPGNDSWPENLTAVKDKLFFTAIDAGGTGLWCYDNIGENLTDLGLKTNSPGNLTNFNDLQLFFTADDPSFGNELWVSDGTSTNRVTDINSGAASSMPEHLYPMGNYLLFSAENTQYSTELWGYMVNSPPESMDTDISMDEEIPHNFSEGDFPFSDPDGDTLASVKITSLPVNGVLKFDSGAVSVNDEFPIADIGKLEYSAPENAFGIAYDNFRFMVRDSFGLLSISDNEMEVTIDPVNDFPFGADSSATINEEETLVFNAAQFNFSDPADPGDVLGMVQITQLPGKGTLKLGGGPIMLNDTIPRADIDAGSMTFEPIADENGLPYDAFKFKVQDINLGLSVDEYTFTINVNPVNDAPTSADNTVAMDSNTTHTFSEFDFAFSDKEGDLFKSVVVTTLATKGLLKFSGSPVTVSQEILHADLDKLTYTPMVDESGSPYANFQFMVKDANDASSASIYQMTINVTAGNNPPTATDRQLTISKNNSHTFFPEGFGFSDPDAGDTLNALRITALESAGSLTLSGVGVFLNQAIAVTDLAASKLVFTPDTDAFGSPYATFKFQVQDIHGAWSAADYTYTINVLDNNFPPSAANNSITFNMNTQHVFTANEFNFTDPDSDAFTMVKIVTTAGKGKLTLNGTDVTANQEIAVTDINAGNLLYTPVANEFGSPYAGFKFQVQDDKGLWSLTDYIFVISLLGNNFPPSAADNSITLEEDKQHVFVANEFNFTDPDGDAFAMVRIIATAGKGNLTLSGTDVADNQEIALTDINAGNLIFTPVANEFGSPYAGFKFQVQNDKGLWSVANYNFVLNVTPVNDAPSAADSSVSLNEDSIHIFKVTEFGYDDLEKNKFKNLVVTELPTKGVLGHNGVKVELNAEIPAIDIANGKFGFKPEPNEFGEPYTSFRFKVQDDGDEWSLTDYQMTVNVIQENTAPTLDDLPRVELLAGQTEHTVNLTGISDGDGGTQTLAISATSDNTSLIPDPSVIYNSPDSTGTLICLPVSGETGLATITVKVQDDGGTGNEGVDATTKSFKFYVLPNPSLVKDINGKTTDSEIRYPTLIGNRVFFRAGDSRGVELWSTNGTSVGTKIVKDINPSGASFPYYLTKFKDHLFFTANDGSHGYELWACDATTLDVKMIADVYAGSPSGAPFNLTDVNGTLFFAADSAEGQNSLWSSDGTNAGTKAVHHFTTSSKHSYPASFTELNGKLFFNAETSAEGWELWSSNGSTTKIFKDIFAGPGSSSPTFMTKIKDMLVFMANDGVKGSELWITNGTPEGTRMLKNIHSTKSAEPYSFVFAEALNIMFFVANGGNGFELWKSDGTPNGTRIVKNINPGDKNAYPEDLVVINDMLYFSATDTAHGRELWVSDGTSEGTKIVKDIYPGVDEEGRPNSSAPSHLTNVNGILCFSADDGENGRELWISDGTAEGTVIAGDIRDGAASSSPDNLISKGGVLLFVADDGTHGRELWRYFVKAKTSNQIRMAVKVQPENAGKLSSNKSKLYNVNLGSSQSLSVIPSAGYSFTSWTVNGNAEIEDAFAANTQVTVNGNVVLTANFAPTDKLASISFLVKPELAGRVCPSDEIQVLKGLPIPLTAKPNPGYVFVKWTSSGDLNIANQYAANTSITAQGDAILTANFATQESGSNALVSPKISIQRNSARENRDKVIALGMSLSETLDSANFAAESTVLTIDGQSFAMSDLEAWKSNEDKSIWIYKGDGIVVRINFSLGIWQAKLQGVTLTSLDNSNGVDIVLRIGDSANGGNYIMSEKSRWSYNASDGDTSEDLTVTGSSMTTFAIEKAAGLIDSKKGCEFIKISKTGLKLTESDDVFDPESHDILLTVDKKTLSIPAGSMQRMGRKAKFIYKDSTKGVKLILDFDKHRWTLSWRSSSANLSSPNDGLGISLTVGGYEGAVKLQPKVKSILSWK